ncbi:MAG: hypothetical protein FD180_716 [Planctomycetota bacterium]|nr:MAG: hypothetical protein FD180_716 [Planctomycetota bacterium]
MFVGPASPNETAPRLSWGQAIQVVLAYPVYLAIMAALIALLAVWSVICKVVATLLGAFTSPVATLEAIPRNWYRVAMCVDALHPPELVPGLELSGIGAGFRFRDVVPSMTNGTSWLQRFLAAVLVCITALAWLPAVLYRYSLKATSIFYAPLVWVVRSATSKHLLDLEDIAHSAPEKAKRVYSLIVIVITIVPILLYSWWANLVHGWESHIDPSFLRHFVFVRFEIDLWHVARFAGAILTLGLYFFADWAHRRSAHGSPCPPGVFKEVVRTVTLVRGLITLYVLACGLWVLWPIFKIVKLPAIGRVFPW